ncbi:MULTISPECIES: hypothetical protein [Methylobacterium]|uniref:hypothetical protein n=1 Tax=Methylobacterium TaxID=407 RepID=UPI00272EA820|nr:hypothetical protein [Methylobacterium sp.]
MVERIGAAVVIAVGFLGTEARAVTLAAEARIQRQLDAMTRHDLCARDDAALKRLRHRLSHGLAGPRR